MSETFLWGAATSAHQVEGDCRHNDWWEWEAQGRIEGGARSGRAADHYVRYKDDLRLAADLGLNAYRFSIEWSRLEPRQGEWNAGALEHYVRLVEECERLGLRPMATLHHFTSPLWFARAGGFAAPGAPALFAKFVERVAASELGARIPLWCTINEPMPYVVGSHLGRFMPPGEYAPSRAADACANLFRAHVEAYDILHARVGVRRGPWASEPVQVGFAHNMLRFKPDRRWNPMELLATKLIDRVYNDAWLSAVAGGPQNFWLPFLLPKRPEFTSARGRKTADFIGVNYYTKAYVCWRPRAPEVERSPESPIGVTFARRTERSSDLGWADHPKGLLLMLRKAARCGVPVIVTENGAADRDDAFRPRYLVEHIRAVARAREEGIDVRGYFHWSLIDNFEWIKGFWPRFGLYRVDYDTYERTATRSAGIYENIVRRFAGGPPTSGATELDPEQGPEPQP